MKKPRISSARVCGYIDSKYPESVLPEREISYRGFVMSKFFAVVLSVLFVIAAAVPAMATDSRLMALGGTEVGNFIEDDYNIFTWYATLPSYTNTVWLGLNYYYSYYDGGLAASADGPSGAYSYLGASYGLGHDGKYGTLAMFYYNYGPPLNTDYESWDGANVFTNSVGNKWTVLYAYPMEKLSLGFYFNRSDESWKNADETETTSEHNLAYTTIGAGVRFDLGEKAYMDLAFDYNMATQKEKTDYIYDYYYGYGEVKQDANTMMGVRGRMFYEWNETVTLVPYVNFRTFDFSLKADSADWKDSHYGNKGMMVDIALAANIKVNEDNLLIFGIEPYGYGKYEPSDPPTGISYKVTDTYMPVFLLALESDVKDWLTFRVGAVKAFYKYETKYEEEGGTIQKYTETGSFYDYYMGLGFHIGDFDIDAVVNNELPFKLGYWLTGYSGWDYYYGDVPIYMLTTTYHF
jgi:hypothetical protein